MDVACQPANSTATELEVLREVAGIHQAINGGAGQLGGADDVSHADDGGSHVLVVHGVPSELWLGFNFSLHSSSDMS